MFRNFRMISNVVFGRGCFDQLGGILDARRASAPDFVVFVVDHAFRDGHPLLARLPKKSPDLTLFIDSDEEPATWTVDDLVKQVRAHAERLPVGVVGIGGGAAMDFAKAVSLLLTNPGSAADYQGWDLIQNPAVYHVAVPTLSGTGAEVSRTTVLIGPEKKLGINSDHTVFDQVVLDPELTAGVPRNQWFYTGMDCYIHCIESLEGSFLNAFSQAYGEKSLELCREVYLGEPPDSADKLMMASFFGGMSIAYSQVGVCHALSYGLSFVLGIHHGVGNCIAFDQLEEYYPEGVREFRRMMERNRVELPRGVTKSLSEEDMLRMANVAIKLEPLWENALGPNWRERMTLQTIIDLYKRM